MRLDKRLALVAGSTTAVLGLLVAAQQGREAWREVRPWAPKAEVAALGETVARLERDRVRRIELEQAVGALRAELAGIGRDLYALAIERLEFRRDLARAEAERCADDPEARCWGERARLRDLERDLEEMRARAEAFRD